MDGYTIRDQDEDTVYVTYISNGIVSYGQIDITGLDDNQITQALEDGYAAFCEDVVSMQNDEPSLPPTPPPLDGINSNIR